MDEEVNGFTVHALCFGDHVELAYRCLGSICNAADPALLRSLRIGLNQVTDNVRKLVVAVAEALPPEVEVLVYDAGVRNRLKYPVMRKMFHDPAHPIVTPFVMWFDDDSYLTDAVGPGWWGDVHRAMQSADLIGAIYHKRLDGDQARMIVAQPWYGGRPPEASFTFATGGWWTVRTRVLQAHDYPFKDIVHNGGDTMLGELIRQQGLRLAGFRSGIRINADAEGREGKAQRRGASTRPVWHDASTPVDRSVHAFVLEAADPRRGPWPYEKGQPGGSVAAKLTSPPPRRMRIPGL